MWEGKNKEAEEYMTVWTIALYNVLHLRFEKRSLEKYTYPCSDFDGLQNKIICPIISI